MVFIDFPVPRMLRSLSIALLQAMFKNHVACVIAIAMKQSLTAAASFVQQDFYHLAESHKQGRAWKSGRLCEVLTTGQRMLNHT